MTAPSPRAYSRAVAAANAERLKLTTLPSNVAAALVALALLVAIGWLSARALTWQALDAGLPPDPLTPGRLLGGVQAAQLLLAIVACLAITSEYAQGTVRASFLAVPTRLPVLFGKAGCLAIGGLLIGLLGATALVNLAPLAAGDAALQWGEVSRAQAIVGCGAYLALIAMLALGIATIIRATVGALLTVIGLLTLAPLLLGVVPVDWVARATAYLPTVAGLRVLAAPDPMWPLAPWQGLAVLAVWAAVALLAASLTLRLRDA